jgi:phosphoenolpyruvate synthase/pyruvate phosphate dikinase
MASRKKKVAKAVPFNTADLANITKANPYIQRLIEDAELRDNVRTAIDSGKSAVNRLSSSKAPQKALLDDKKLQSELRAAAEALRDAAMALSDAPKRSKPKRKLGLGRKLLFLVVAAGAALALSESLRSKVLDTLFGAEEEFQYTPPAGTPTPPPASPVTAA